jgi:co-chaperonin GroES (HSP10)
MSKIYQALGSNIFVEEKKQETKIGELFVPESINDDIMYGEVISAPTGYFDKGSFITIPVAVGDIVAFYKTSSNKITLGGRTFICIDAKDLLAVEVEGEILDKEGK